MTVHTSTSMGTRVDGFHFCLSFAAVEGLRREVVAEQEESSRFWWKISERAASSKIRSGRSECAHLGGNSLVPLV